MNETKSVIAIRDMTKTYQMGETLVHALRDVSLTIDPGEYVAIVGASGSGKSTMMNMIGLLDQPTSGSYRLLGGEVSKIPEEKLANLRNRYVGFVFQQFNLLPLATAQRQVELPLFYAGESLRSAKEKSLKALAQVGLQERAHHRPEQLSGGQRQRVAIARALVNQPSLLLADEPTGALDSKTGAEILRLFQQLHAQGLTLIVVTHDKKVASQAQRVIEMRDGQIVSDRPQRRA